MRKKFIVAVLPGLAWIILFPAGFLYAQNSDQRQPQFTESGTEACMVCHSGEKMQAIQEGARGAGSGLPTPMVERGCESCHGPGSFHVSRAHGGSGFPNMINFGEGANVAPREIQLGACLDCHSETRGQASEIVFINSPHDEKEINCATCHTGHVARDPVVTDMAVQSESCFSCHDKMREEHNPFDGMSIDLASLSCATCHDVHAVRMK